MKRFDVADRPITGYETIGVTRLTPTIGATLDGIDLSRPISEQQLTEVKRALAEHLVIFFRDQKMSVEQHKDFGRRFGELQRVTPEWERITAAIEDDAEAVKVLGERRRAGAGEQAGMLGWGWGGGWGLASSCLLTGRLTVGDAPAQTVRLRWWGGD
jgi:alpha-ketoglutarate-dependent taurine dioxygenase